MNEVSTIIHNKMKDFEKKQDEKLAELTKTITQTVSEGIMNVITKQMDSKFDKYMNKILTAIEKLKIEKTTPTPHIQQSQNSYFPT